MTYIRFRNTPAGDFFFSYERKPGDRALDATAQQLHARGGWTEMRDEAAYMAGLREDEERWKNANRELVERWLGKKKPSAVSPETGADAPV